MLNRTSDESLDSATEATYVAGGHTFVADHGVLSYGSSSSRDSGRFPFPATVHVHVLTHEQGSKLLPGRDYDVPVHGHIPDEDHFTGILWLVVYDDKVVVFPETFDHEMKRFGILFPDGRVQK